MRDRLKRGNVVIASDRSDYGKKPRPMLVVQADRYLGQTESATACVITTTEADAPLFRIAVSPTEENGLDGYSYICADKVMTVKAEKIAQCVGIVSEPMMRSVDEALRRWLDL